MTLLTVAGCWLVVHRSAFSDRRRTDAGVYFRAGYAVHAGKDPYSIVDENEWYFLYPPAIAAAFVPLADPPDAEPLPPDPDHPNRPTGYVPYPVAIAVWYFIGVGCLVLSVELLARTLTQASPDPLVRALSPARGGWWAMRIWPLVMVLPDAASTLSRGQINTVVLACVCAGVWALSRARWFWGGFLFALAACTKVLPGIYLLDLCVRHAGRALLGWAVGAGLMVGLIPILVYGPHQAIELTREWSSRVLLAGLAHSAEQLQAGTLYADTDNLSIQGALHNLTNIATPRGLRPEHPATWIVLLHALIAAALLALSLTIGRRTRLSRPDSGLQILLRIGMLSCVMLAAAPMVHRHYYIYLLPAVFPLICINLMRSPLAVPHGRGMALALLYPSLLALPRVEQAGVLRDLPIPLAVDLVVWSLCALQLASLAREAAPNHRLPTAAHPSKGESNLDPRAATFPSNGTSTSSGNGWKLDTGNSGRTSVAQSMQRSSAAGPPSDPAVPPSR